jgi:hypothetical protein
MMTTKDFPTHQTYHQSAQIQKNDMRDNARASLDYLYGMRDKLCAEGDHVVSQRYLHGCVRRGDIQSR